MPTYFKIILLGLSCTLLLAAPTKANASGGTVLVLVSGSEDSKLLLQSNAESALRSASIAVRTGDQAELTGFDIAGTIECVDNDRECTALLQRAPMQWVLFLRSSRDSEGPDANTTVVAKLFSADTGELLQVEQRICERCSSAERLAKLTTELVADIAASELAHEATATFLEVSSSPENAILSIDGNVVGTTGDSYRITPGDHVIKVHLDGHRPAEQTITVGANEHKAVSFSLERLSSKKPSSTNLRTVFGWGAIGVGSAAMAAGLVWIAVDGEPAHSEGEIRDTVINDTKGLGVTSLIVGGVLVGTGITLLLTDSTDPEAVAVSALPTPTGFALGLSGQF